VKDIEGKTALITGGSRGIGKAIALAFGNAGLNVVVNYRISETAAKEVANQIDEAGGMAICIRADVSNQKEVAELVHEVISTFGGIDIVVNNAGIVHKDDLDNITEADWDRVLNINLKSAFLVTQACLPHMRKKKWGRIINISSVAALTGGVTSPVYVASKAGMLGLTRSYAALLVEEGITANSIAPALIETDMVTKDLNITPEKIPLGRFGTTNEIADIALMLAKNAYMTGQTIHANGGWYFT